MQIAIARIGLLCRAVVNMRVSPYSRHAYVRGATSATTELCIILNLQLWKDSLVIPSTSNGEMASYASCVRRLRRYQHGVGVCTRCVLFAEILMSKTEVILIGRSNCRGCQIQDHRSTALSATKGHFYT